MTSLTINERTISDAWLASVMAVDALPKHHRYHLIVRIEQPDNEVPAIRAVVDKMIAHINKNSAKKNIYDVDSVRNTIFPAEIARTSTTPEQLATRYRGYYPRLQKCNGNHSGTYFGRLVALPSIEGDIDQLNNLIAKLRDPRNPDRRTRFELDLGVDAAIYRAHEDRSSLMGFPCLSFLSFQREGRKLHMVAFYRHQYLIGRGYGNYLGLGQLLAYVAGVCKMEVGELLIVAGHAEVDLDVARGLFRPFIEKATRSREPGAIA